MSYPPNPVKSDQEINLMILKVILDKLGASTKNAIISDLEKMANEMQNSGVNALTGNRILKILAEIK